MTISVDAEKGFTQIKHKFKINALSYLGIEENLLSLIKISTKENYS